jgi:glutamate/tyrosine decarboxylase-like PLP-dependent enzyme
LQRNIRKEGVASVAAPMIMYCSTETHNCVQKSVEILGIGSDNLRKISVNERYEMRTDELLATLKSDLAKGYLPFCVVASAGTVNTGAIDPLEEILAICKEYNLWLHIDGAYGAVAKLDPQYAERLRVIEEADSVAFDWHKWLYVNYEVACVLIKNAEAHRNAFSVQANYLLNFERGLAAGPDPLTNFGFELSRGFKALKIWMSLKEHGIQKYARMITQNNAQAEYLAQLIDNQPDLEILAPVSMSIVCFRFRKNGLSEDELTAFNKELLMRVQEQGIASPSSTFLNGVFAIRVCIVNQRTKQEDLEVLVRECVRIGRSL